MNTLSNEQLESVSAFLSPENINRIAVILENAENGLNRAAYENDELNYMFRFAYEVRQLRTEVETIEKKLGYEPDRD